MAVKRAGKDKMVKGAAREKGGSRSAPTEGEKAGEAEAKAKIEEEAAEVERRRLLIKAALGKRYAGTFKVSGDPDRHGAGGPALSEEEIAARDESWDK